MSKQSLFIGIFLSSTLLIGISYCSNYYQSKRYAQYGKQSTKGGNIDSLLHTLHEIGGETGLGDMNTIYEEYQSEVKNIQAQTPTLSKGETEKLRQHFLNKVSPQSKQDFLEELNTKFEVQSHQDFFKRQIKYAQNNLDMAVIGVGILGVHKTYEGSNIYVKEGEIEQYINFIRDQVQSSIASSDMNYKAIVFKGIESSIY